MEAGRGRKTKAMAATAVVTAALCVLGPGALPIGPVPVTLATLLLYLSVYVLDLPQALWAAVLYLFLGACGLPVFSGYQGGPGCFAGATGGFLAGYPLLVLCSGLGVRRGSLKASLLGMGLGTLMLYALGVLWLSHTAGLPLWTAAVQGMLPFLPGDMGKMGAALWLGPRIRKALKKRF